MMTLALLAFLVVGSTLCFGREASPVKTALAWSGVGLGLFVASGIGNPFLAVVVALAALNIWRYEGPEAWPSVHVMTYVYPIAAFAGMYAVVAPRMHAGMIEPILWTMVAIASFIGCWGCYSVYVYATTGKNKYKHVWNLPGGYKFRLWEMVKLEAGQTNGSHTQSVGALGVGAAMGLVLLGYDWAWAVAILPLMAVLTVQTKSPEPTQGIVYLTALVGAWLFLKGSVWSNSALVLLGLAAVVYFARFGDHGRVSVWTQMVKDYWWNQSWSIKLLGCGTGSWVILHLHRVQWEHQQTKQTIQLFTAGHNEYIQQLVEHGAIGVVALLLYIGTALAACLGAGAAGHAVFLLGVTVCAVAMLHFPWILYHEVVLPSGVNGHGSPTLMTWSMMIALMAEAVR